MKLKAHVRTRERTKNLNQDFNFNLVFFSGRSMLFEGTHEHEHEKANVIHEQQLRFRLIQRQPFCYVSLHFQRTRA